MKDINKNIPENIKYFDIMDKIYSLKPETKEIDFKFLFEKYKKINRKKEYKNATLNNIPCITNKNNKQLFSLVQDLIKLFILKKKIEIYIKN